MRKHLWQLRNRTGPSAVTFHDGLLQLAASPPAANDTLAFSHCDEKPAFLFWERGWICSANEAFVPQPEERSSNLSQRQAGPAFGLKGAYGNTHSHTHTSIHTRTHTQRKKNETTCTVASG